MEASVPILSVKDLVTSFVGDAGEISVLRNVSFDLRRGETLGIVGESGSGKSVLNLSLLRLLPPSARVLSGEVIFDGRDVLGLNESELRQIRGRRMAMVFQDPMTSLNPYRKIGSQLTETTRGALGHSRATAADHARKMLRSVGIPDAERVMTSYPHELSGGMRQRVLIAMALSSGPDVLIADEATTALDVTVQAEVLELIKRLGRENGTSVLLVTHDLGVAAGMTDRVLVMYAGRVFESAATDELFARPSNPYTRALLQSIPDGTPRGGRLFQIAGSPPDPSDVSAGCRFAPRCEYARDVCRSEEPTFLEVAPGHSSLCHFARELYSGGVPAEK